MDDCVNKAWQQYHEKCYGLTASFLPPKNSQHRRALPLRFLFYYVSYRTMFQAQIGSSSGTRVLKPKPGANIDSTHTFSDVIK